MKELIVISGKGGTGKTSLLAAFASLARDKVLCDADVDAADLHLILAPSVQQTHEFESGNRAIIQNGTCTQCGLCRDLCNWHAINDRFIIDPIACEGCGVCAHFCPEQAIDFPSNVCGKWFYSTTRFGPMVHARLGIAEENSGKLVALVRQESRKVAAERQLSLILTDGPPGVGCPVIAAIGGTDAVLIVTEPTVSGKHDMQRVLDLAAHFKVPALVCINKYDLNLDMTAEIETYTAQQGLPAMGRIPFDPVFTRSMVQGKTLFEYDGNAEAGRAVRQTWQNISNHMKLETTTKEEHQP